MKVPSQNLHQLETTTSVQAIDLYQKKNRIFRRGSDENGVD
jgi:hypothetical protein